MTALQAWPFVIAAYAVAITGTVVLVVASFASMRRAEKRAEALDQR